MFVWDAHVAFVGFTLQTTIDGINSSFKTQPGHLLWEASLDSSEEYHIRVSQTAAIWIHLGKLF